MKEEKIDYWKVICDEYPLGVYCSDRLDALMFSKECRESGEKAIVRKIRITKEELSKIPELD